MIYFTHDIDWLSPLHPFSFVKLFTHRDKWITPSGILNKNIFVDEIQKLVSFNKNHQLDAIWMIGASQQSTLNRYGLRYTIHHPNYKKVINLLKQQHCKIGLHSVSNESFSKQCKRFESVNGIAVKYHRSHYLKFNWPQLLHYLASNHVALDFSLGKARKVELMELKGQTPVKVVPTVLFDNAFFFNKPQQVFDDFIRVMEKANATNQDVAILFHPENFVIHPKLWEYYHEIVMLTKKYAC